MRRWRALLAGIVVAGAIGLGPVTAADAAPSSRCTTRSGLLTSSISCSRTETRLWTGRLGITPRDVHWQVPVGTPPPGGWPAVVSFSPSFYSAEIAWTASSLLPQGAYHSAATIKALLDAGFAVIAPESHLEGFTFWDTNVPLLDYGSSPDRYFVEDILAAIEDGTFGPIDPDRLFAMGMSSGGYMTSRMAVSHRGRFQALAIQSASYATCIGPICNVPSNLPADHPPTLFLHGKADLVVPILTMYPYRDRLRAQGIETRTVTSTFAGHEFLPSAPGEIVSWFRAHDPGV